MQFYYKHIDNTHPSKITTEKIQIQVSPLIVISFWENFPSPQTATENERSMTQLGED